MANSFKQAARTLLDWAEERQRIYLAKQEGKPWPWTQDPIMQRFYFCNTYREQDKVTVWIRQQWREPYDEHKNLWFAMAVARQINWPDTLEAIGFPTRWSPARVLEIMRSRAAEKRKNYSGAYMLTAGGGNLGVDKPFITVNKILTPLYEAVTRKRQLPPWLQPGNNASLEASCQWLKQFYGFGPFLSYEVVTDLRHTRYLRNAPDIYTWANPGPGARRGLNRLFERPVKMHPPQKQLVDEMRALLVEMDAMKDKSVLPHLEMRDVEHSLCEVWKYIRTKEQLESGGRVGLDLYRPRTQRRLFD